MTGMEPTRAGEDAPEEVDVPLSEPEDGGEGPGTARGDDPGSDHDGDSSEAGGGGETSEAPPSASSPAFYGLFRYKPKHEKVLTKIDLTRYQKRALEEQLEETQTIGSHVTACENHLMLAERAVERTTDDVNSAYQALFAARRELTYLRACAAGEESTPGGPFVHREAKKLLTRAENELSGWTFFLTLNMLTAEGSRQLREDLTIDDVIDVQQIHDEQSLKRIEMADVLERQHGTFMQSAKWSSLGIIVLALVAPYLVSFTSWVSGWRLFGGFGSGAAMSGLFGELSAQYGATLFVAVALFGLLGASLSGLFTLRGVAPSARMPLGSINLETLADARLATGVGSALVLVTVVESGAPGMIFALDIGFSTPAMALLVAFVAGFSERFLVRAMVKVTGEEGLKPDFPSILQYGPRQETADRKGSAASKASESTAD